MQYWTRDGADRPLPFRNQIPDFDWKQYREEQQEKKIVGLDESEPISECKLNTSSNSIYEFLLISHTNFYFYFICRV